MGLSETKLKDHKSTEVFKVDVFQTPFRKDNNSNGGGGLTVYVRNGLNAKRRKDLETNNIPCLWLEIAYINCKPFLVGNIYKPPDSKVEFNDRVEEFIDKVISEDKEYILMGEFNNNNKKKKKKKNVYIEWGNFTTSLGLTQLIDEPTRVTTESQTLIDHIYTNTEEKTQCVAAKKICITKTRLFKYIENFTTKNWKFFR